jgi:EAL domain-containing protein (putative c-di-GMP-specific phosphodiesterase class I)
MRHRDPTEPESFLRDSELPTLGEALPRIVDGFTTRGAIGLVLIDASCLSGIERSYGGEAHRRSLQALGALVQQASDLGIDDLIALGETGRDEIVIMIFREPTEAGFYQRELPALCRRLAESLARRGNRIGYPYLTRPPRLAIGNGAALRNPTIGAATQIRGALEEAREHAALTARFESRRRRQRLFEVVLSGKVRSVYEPIVDVNTRTVFGYEALARGPEGTELHSPLALFETASEGQGDLIFQLDCLCRQSGLSGARDLPADTKLFLNVRPTTIHDPSFRAEALSRTLETCDLPPSSVVFEISEQESIGNFDIFREVRDYYRKLGFQIALDDVGAGYSSLESVMELVPEFIKVDRAFVHGIDEDPARQELLRAMCAVAEQIGARIIGEGLDTLEELETLGRLGIPFGQGWLFGKPTPLRADV